MNAFVFVYRGEGRFGKSRQPGKSGQALILETTGASTFTAVAHTESNLKFLLLAGQPINEPIARSTTFGMVCVISWPPCNISLPIYPADTDHS